MYLSPKYRMYYKGVYVWNIYASTHGWVVLVFIHGQHFMSKSVPFIYWHSHLDPQGCGECLSDIGNVIGLWRSDVFIPEVEDVLQGFVSGTFMPAPMAPEILPILLSISKSI